MAFSASLRRVLCRSSSSSAPLTFAPLSSPVRFNSSLVSKTKLFVSGLSRLTTDEKLKEAFSPFGQLLEGMPVLSSFFFGLVDYLASDLQALKLDGFICKLMMAAKVITDRASGRSKGFGFVRYATEEEATNAREGMNAKFLDGWVIFVDPAKPREPRPPPPPEPNPSEAGFRVNKTIGWCG
ncbi:Glycine-rich RNA-binding protein 4 [Nymphaea thermarum]|nr:Glycine-rich RNA-binding protein 4 [Nymphaea thermarum]